ncbi:Iron-binding protein IscA [Arsenophonus endosymbiont of Bemisia tabaci Q2]|nr:Iron-binding protein IscA [Arsenophonus endosymbiont of Bemisia tabaci Q2]
MSMFLTENAAERILTFLHNLGKGKGLRLSVRISGCSGMAYVLEFVDIINEEDTVFEDKGVKVIVDGKSIFYLNGTELDFVKEGFKFNNANSKNECGCGESFIAKRLNFDDIICMSYTIDFRRKVIFTMEEEGLSIRETAKQFRIGSASV